MTHKVNPKIFRIGIKRDWASQWFSEKDYQKALKEDVKIRNFLEKKYENGIIEEVKIERSGNKVNVKIITPKPGLLIGRSGEGVEKLSRELNRLTKRKELKVDIEETKELMSQAEIVAQQIASELERRIPYRKVVKRVMSRVWEKKQVKGVKVKVKGRLDGAEMARSQTFKEGKLPLQTLRANIDYAYQLANCNAGAIGVKVWIYKSKGEQS